MNRYFYKKKIIILILLLFPSFFTKNLSAIIIENKNAASYLRKHLFIKKSHFHTIAHHNFYKIILSCFFGYGLFRGLITLSSLNKKEQALDDKKKILREKFLKKASEINLITKKEFSERKQSNEIEIDAEEKNIFERIFFLQKKDFLRYCFSVALVFLILDKVIFYYEKNRYSIVYTNFIKNWITRHRKNLSEPALDDLRNYFDEIYGTYVLFKDHWSLKNETAEELIKILSAVCDMLVDD